MRAAFVLPQRFGGTTRFDSPLRLRFIVNWIVSSIVSSSCVVYRSASLHTPTLYSESHSNDNSIKYPSVNIKEATHTVTNVVLA